MAGADVVVIGGGPAGLFCAIHASRPGCHVVLFEKNGRPGAKLLLSGSGQCNLTHAGEIREFFSRYGGQGSFIRPSLMGFSNHDLMRFFSDRGLSFVTEENRKVFPRTRLSGDVLDILLQECRERGVEIRCNEPVTEVKRDHDGFTVITGTSRYPALTVVITTGGASYPGTGSTGDGYRFAASLGQPVTEIAPALTPVHVRGYQFKDLAGISFEQALFTLWRDGKKRGSYRGDVLLTHTGLSGPGILDASRDIRPGDVLRLSFTGNISREEFSRELAWHLPAHGMQHVRSVITGFAVPERLVKKVLSLAGIPENLTCAHLTVPQRKELALLCTEFPFTVDTPGDFSCAMATRGGVELAHVDRKTLESKIVPGLFFAGEVLDIDGDTGGYNLQAAFSTGYCAALGIRKRLSRN